MIFRLGVLFLALISIPVPLSSEEEDPRLLSDEVIPVDPARVPQRPKPILELGNPFLSTGPIGSGFKIPGGAVWQPSLLVFGTYRTAIQAFHDGDDTFSEWANRLDLFVNLQLTGTERLLFGVRPLDEDGRFTGYRFNGPEEGREDEFNFKFMTLFFEGELGELFPDLDPGGRGSLDLGFSVGRQQIFLQEGILINDFIDTVGLTKDALSLPGGSDLQATLLYGFNEIHRNDNVEDRDAQLLALLFEGDLHKSTVNLDLAYVFDTEDRTEGTHWALSSVQRIGHYNTSFRYLGSDSSGSDTSGIRGGHLLFFEGSKTLAGSEDLLYLNAFVGFNEFSSAARDPATGGPLGRIGILFEAIGLGRYGSPLSNRPDDAAGGSLGLQLFSEDYRRQAIFEVGARNETKAGGRGEIAAAGRFQQAFGQHLVLQFDLFGAVQEERDEAWGARTELRVEF